MSDEIVSKVIVLVITIGLPVLLRWLFVDVWGAVVAYYRSRTSQNVRLMVDDIIHTAVIAAEQLHLAGTLEDWGKAKLDYALDIAITALERQGIDIDGEQIRALIEAEVWNQFRHWQDMQQPAPATPDEQPQGAG